MSADVLANDLKTRLHLRTKTIGAERIKKAKDNNEDIAVLSQFLPGPTAEIENKRFRCVMGEDCFLGDHRSTVPGNLLSMRYPLKDFFHSFLQFCKVLCSYIYNFTCMVIYEQKFCKQVII